MDYSTLTGKTESTPSVSKTKQVYIKYFFIKAYNSYCIFPQDSETKSKAVGTVDTSSELVETRSGAIKGIKIISEEGLTHYQFHGIPYAQAPVGRLRFKAPLPIRPWTDILDASKKGPYCY